MCEKCQMKSERVEISVCGFECCMLDAKKVLSTLKEMVQFVHEVHPIFDVILSTFANMLCGSTDDAMPSFNLL